MKRYSAKLLFQYRVVVDGKSGKRRICEERIIVLHAAHAKQALIKAKARGKASQFNYVNDEGNPVFFEFVGVLDLLELGIECEADEVWYDIVERMLPSERRNKLLPDERKLSAIRLEASRRSPTGRARSTVRRTKQTQAK